MIHPLFVMLLPNATTNTKILLDNALLWIVTLLGITGPAPEPACLAYAHASESRPAPYRVLICESRTVNVQLTKRCTEDSTMMAGLLTCYTVPVYHREASSLR